MISSGVIVRGVAIQDIVSRGVVTQEQSSHTKHRVEGCVIVSRGVVTLQIIASLTLKAILFPSIN